MTGELRGEFAALLTAVFWTITALSFESASKKAGSLSVNLLRLLFAFVFLSVFQWITSRNPLPLNASSHNWIWLSVSGLIGFVIGDLLLFQSYVIIGARIAMLIMALTPPIAALTGWIVLNESMNLQSLLGMLLTLSGISLAILSRPVGDESGKTGSKGKLKLKYPLHGLLLALGGAVGQGVGLVLSKLGMQNYGAFPSTQIRVITGIIGFALVITFRRNWKNVKLALSNVPAMRSLTFGAFFGPFLGVSFSLLAVKYTSSGIASTIMAITPVMIIAPSAIIFHEKVTSREILGAMLAVAGVALFFI